MPKIYTLVDAAGLTAAILLIATFLFGILDLNFTVHKALAVATLIAACTHGSLVGYQRLKIRMARKKQQASHV